MMENLNTIGGALWINLLNTKRMREGQVMDVLGVPKEIHDWMNDNFIGIMENTYPVEKLLELRTAFINVVNLFLNENNYVDLSTINSLFMQIPLRITIEMQEGNVAHRITALNQEHEVVAKIINNFIETVEQYGLKRIRQCAHDECILYFLDTSKGGKRKWCDMDTCGNRIKASSFYNRKKGKL